MTKFPIQSAWASSFQFFESSRRINARATHACKQVVGDFPNFNQKAGTGKANLHHNLGGENGRSNANHIQLSQMISNFTA
jgi:hypothetical protein